MVGKRFSLYMVQSICVGSFKKFFVELEFCAVELHTYLYFMFNAVEMWMKNKHTDIDH